MENDRYEVRAAVVDDIEDLVRMRLSLQGHIQSKNTDLWGISRKRISRLNGFYRLEIENADSRVLVVEDLKAGGIVGMAMGKKLVNENYIPNTTGKIEDVWIEPPHRRKGLCSRLIADLVRFFRSENIQALTLDYARGNSEAEAFWTRLGFRPVIITATASLREVAAGLSTKE